MLNNNKSDIFYNTGLILTSFYCIVLYSSYVRVFFSKIVIAGILIGIVMLFFSSICMSKWPIRVIAPVLLVLLIVIISWRVLEKNILLLYFFLIFASYRKSLQSTFKILAYSTIVFTIFVIVCSLIGVIPNEVFAHGTKDAYCLGFFYYSSVSYNTLFSTLILLGLKNMSNRRRVIIRICLYLLINFLAYVVTTARLTIIIVSLSVVAYIWIYRKKEIVITKRTRIILALMYPISAILNYMVVLFYNPSNRIMYVTNIILNSRLILTKQGLEKYQITLFGNQIESINEVVNGYQRFFYIDNGYINSLLQYGIILFCVIIFSYSIISVYAAENNQKLLLLLCIVTCFFCNINNVLLSVALNPLLLMTPNVLAYRNRLKEK